MIRLGSAQLGSVEGLKIWGDIFNTRSFDGTGLASNSAKIVMGLGGKCPFSQPVPSDLL